MFKVSFENLGVLSSGEVTIKPLTILCGENNSGKTYLNYSVYGMMKELFDYSAKNLSKYLPFPLEALRETGKAIIDLEEFLKNGFHKMLEEFSSHYSKSIHKIFNTSKNNFTYTKFQLTIDESYWFPLIKEHDIKFLYAGSRSNNVDDFEGKKKSGSFQFELSFKAAQEYFEVDEIKEYLSSGITKILFRFFKGVLLLPAERAGLNLFFKELNVSRSALVDELKNASAEDLSKLLNSKTAIYPQPVTDYLHIISRLALSETELKIYDHFSEQLIKEIIQGTYQIDEEQIYFIPSGNNIKINFHVSSSAVKTLFGLFYCLTFMNDLDSCLIIDEPELNLHPDNQRKIARLLARLANRGIPVIISTHSDYIVKEINNLVMLKEDFPEKKALMKKYGYAEAELLSPDMLSINLVSGGKLTSLVVNSTEGVAVETFDRVINDLNESSDEIYYTKRDSLDE